MIRKKRLWLAGKYTLYALLVMILYSFQTTVGFLEIAGVRPIWVLPFAIAIAMTEGVLPGAIFGMICGLLCDLGSQALFGFNGIVVLCGCSVIGLLCLFLVKVNWKSALLLGAALSAARALLEFFFFYLIWSYEGVSLIFIRSTLPTLVYTALFTPLFLFLVQKIKFVFDSKWQE